jgi:branched-chain amino acid aminotransferase
MNVKENTGWSPSMFVSRYQEGEWDDGSVLVGSQITQYIATSGIQFGQSVFEGFCLFRHDGDIYSFRLDKNYERLTRSCNRLCIPFPGQDLFYSAVSKIAESEEQWKSPQKSDILYIRPVVYGCGDFQIYPLPSEKYVFAVLCTPYLPPKQNEEGVSVYVETEYSRTVDHGLGASKTGANYAHIHFPVQVALKRGFDTTLWLDSREHRYIEETNVANIFFETQDGLITPALNGNFLAGITRDSIIRLACEGLGIEVAERSISIDEVAALSESNRLISAFITGTAVGMMHIDRLFYQNSDLRPKGKSPLFETLRSRFFGIRTMQEPDIFNWYSKIHTNGHRRTE